MLGRCAVGRRAPVGVVTAPPAPLRRSPASVSPAFALLNSGASPWSVTSACTRFAVQARGAVTVPAAQERKGSHSTASTSGTAAGSAPTHVPRQSGVRDGACTLYSAARPLLVHTGSRHVHIIVDCKVRVACEQRFTYSRRYAFAVNTTHILRAVRSIERTVRQSTAGVGASAPL